MSEKLDALVFHGVVLTGSAGDQAIGTCPFCNKEGHFYVHKEKVLWDCKVCGRKGNLGGFLEQIAKQNEEALSPEALSALAKDRKLPLSSFRKYGLGWNGEFYTIPVKSFTGTCVDLRCYSLGSKTRATPGCSLGLLGAERLASEKGAPAYVCEGEWDGFALEWLRLKLGKEGVVVAVPGATIFKNDWVSWFSGREVYALHDNDAAGESGRNTLAQKLAGIASSVKLINWPPTLPAGFDVRDFVVQEALKAARPRAAWTKLHTLLKAPGNPSTASEKTPESALGTKIDPKEVALAYRKWLHLPSDEVLRVIFGTVFANKLQGDPIWLFLVAPPGGSKSELLTSISRSPLVESTTSLTPHSLVSGAHNNGSDPSLLPRLNGRILVIKDFTTILSMHYTSRDEIFGVLRDVYDGKTEKVFGTGLKRTYVSHFGIIAGVTPKIEEFGVLHQSLGERFLKYRINMGQRNISETDRIRRALDNINKEDAMREDLAKVASACMLMPVPTKLPTVPGEITEYLIHLAQTCAMMRGVVERDRFSGHVIYKPSIEIGTRLAKQLTKIALGIAIYLQQSSVDIPIYRTVRRIALDTAPDRIEEIVYQIWRRTEDKDSALSTNTISSFTRLPVATCFRVLQDLELLKLVDRLGQGNKYEWRISSKLEALIVGGRVYERGLGRDTV